MSDCFNMITFLMDSQVLIFKDVLEMTGDEAGRQTFPVLLPRAISM